MHLRSRLLVLVAGVSVAASVACSMGSPSGASSSDESAVIGGVDAKSARLDAIGALVYRDRASRELKMLCTATLVARDVVLSAKHCAVDFTRSQGADGGAGLVEETRIPEVLETYFAMGWDALGSARLVRATSVDLCMDYSGGATNLGCDVATFRLAEPVTDVAPLQFARAHPGEDLVGQRLTVVGYGTQDAAGTKNGTRRAGTVTVRATSGNGYKAAYPTLDAFVDAVELAEGPAFVANQGAAIQKLYESDLKAGYELFSGGAEGDAQLCHGDSGGPLLRRVDGKLVVVGVASTVAFSGAKSLCNLGGIHATLGPKAQDLLARSLAPDPCERIPPAGRCEGDVVVRCTEPSEGPRRVTRTDCSALLGRCVSGEDGGTAHCGD